jgi:ABC-2 type transport system ATP-binding protein
MPGEILASVSHVSRSFFDRLAVDDVSFDICRGEVLGLLGPNGAGKTSTMRMLCGILAPGGGRIAVGGHDIVEAPEPAKALIGYLPEQPPLYPDLTVDQYLEFCAGLRRIPGRQRAVVVGRAREKCGLMGFGRRLIGNLSKGYQQRVGIAQAIVHDPPLIVLDEPTVGLDPVQIVEVRSLIRELGADHGVLVATHILPEVRAACDRVLIIGNGRVLLDQSLATLHQCGDGAAFIVALRAPPAPEALRAVPSVTAVQQLDALRFRVSAADGPDTAAQLAVAAARGGWGLFELVPETDTLEQTFLRLTRDDGGGTVMEPRPR